MYIPEDENQALVETPYGRGLVVRTRRQEDEKSAHSHRRIPTMHEIELLDWKKPERTKGPNRPSVLYSPTSFPSISPTVGDDVTTMFGRGTVTEVRSDGMLVVRISSWRLANRSIVMSFLSKDSVQVIRKKKIYEMSVFEKVEHAQKLKDQASTQFASKDYAAALQLYAEAVDAVRYVQHKDDSTNHVRADLLLVMISCSNNAATCCLQMKDWDRAQKFGKNALVLLEALYEKKENSNILKILNREGSSNSKLFGAWMVKSHLLIARGLAERFSSDQSIETLKKALDLVSEFKVEGDPMFRQLQSQEKEVRKLLIACRERIKAEKKKEKQRARAMFGVSEEKKESEIPAKVEEGEMTKETEAAAMTDTEERNSTEGPNPRLKKRVSFKDGTKPGEVVDDEGPSFLEEHKEALLLLAGVALGSIAVLVLGKRNASKS